MPLRGVPLSGDVAAAIASRHLLFKAYPAWAGNLWLPPRRSLPGDVAAVVEAVYAQPFSRPFFKVGRRLRAD